LWENFAVLHALDWLPELTERAGVHGPVGPVAGCNWSYGWVRERPTRKILDLVIHYVCATGDEGVIVVEAKNRGVALKRPKDLDPGYYLNVPEFAAFPHRSLIYLVDETAIPASRQSIEASTHDVGWLSWQELGTIQMSAAHLLPIGEGLRTFVARAIQRQYLALGIQPTRAAADYLDEEQSRHELDKIPPKSRQTNEERQRPLWRV
jgi:hypothetical protein